MSLLGAVRTPRPVALALRRSLLPVVLAALLAGCGIAANDDVQPSAAIAPQASLSTTLELCRNDVSGALGAAGLNLVPPTSAARPAEAPLLMAAPRTVGQVILPGDPTHGYIVIYQFPDPASAYTAAVQQADYVAGGEGTIQFLPDSRFTLRQDGSCVVFYVWAPSVSTDPHSPDIEARLDTVGVAIPIVH